MKAVILARGLGTRMRRTDAAVQLDAAQRAAAEQGLKALMPVGRPFLDYALGALADAGFNDICIVIGPEHRVVRDHVATLALRRLRVTFVEQAEPKGTADAVLAAERFAGRDRFLVVNADNLYPVDVLAATRQLTTPGLPAFAAQALVRKGNLRPERVGRFPLVKFDAAGWLTELMERDATPGPGDGPSEYISMNCWLFDATIFAACRAVEPSPRGELEITSAVRDAIAGGARYRVLPVSEPVLDVTSRDDVSAVTSRLTETKVQL
jgi:glucose-1-phosphate thymidylyltransferase